MALRFITIICLVALAGCMPAWVRTSPTVTGRLTSSGAAVPGADVFLIRTFSTCEASRQQTVTASDGTFSISGAREFQILGPEGHFVQWAAVCFKVEGQWFLGFGESLNGFFESRIKLGCDLSAPVVQSYRAERFRKVIGLCHSGDV
jgi:hypothetical protein